MTNLTPSSEPLITLIRESERMMQALREIRQVTRRAADNHDCTSAIADIDAIIWRLSATGHEGEPLPFEDAS